MEKNTQEEEISRQEALDAIFDDDPLKKARDKEYQKLEKKRRKQQEKADKRKKNKTGADVETEDMDENKAEAANIASDASAEQAVEENEKEPETKKEKRKQAKQEKKAEKEKQDKEEINIVRDLISLCIYIVVVVIACWLILTYVGQRTEVSGDSMNDTLHSGDSLWIDKISYRFHDPERYDIVVFPYGDDGETYYIKRIIGLPGETVYIDEDGVIYINGEALESDHYGKEIIEEVHRGIAVEPVILGEDEYFVMGDNRNNSRDSRISDVGNIHKDEFIGKAVFRFKGGFGFINRE